MISRRKFFTHAATLAGLVILPGAGHGTSAVVSRPAFASAFSDSRKQHFIGILSHLGTLIQQYAVPSRGHAATVSTDGRLAAFFARRPGRWLFVVDIQTGKLIAQIATADNRHFYGHGVFSQDNAWLFSTENDYENKRGVIGVYDVKAGFKRIREIPSFGVGPHEIGLLANGKTLVVANGGIETHPDFERHKLNLDTMSPSLTYIDLASGEEIASYKPPQHQLSLRHLAVYDDTVVVGAQYQGHPQDELPLVFSHRLGGEIQAMSGQPLSNQRQLNQYIASVAFADEGRIAVTSSPRGDGVSLWNVQKSQWLKDVSVPDIGGVSTLPIGKNVVLGSGNGLLYLLQADSGSLTELSRHEVVHWDNHLAALSLPVCRCDLPSSHHR